MQEVKEAGSSPRVRGKHWLRVWSRYRPGLIPACAGKTERKTIRYPEHWAHPRVCGENVFKIADGNAYTGSSPRVRGKLFAKLKEIACAGLIPACAGKTLNDLEF